MRKLNRSLSSLAGKLFGNKFRLLGILGAIAPSILPNQSAMAFSQPPANLSATTFMDGGGPQGLFYLNYSIFTEGKEGLDKNGDKIPGGAQVNVLVQLHQFYYHSPLKFLGATVGFDVFLPLVSPSSRGSLGPVPMVSNTAGLGDIGVGPALHWDGHMLFGRPAFHRVESDVIFPTGKYDKNMTINPGSNLTSIDSFYSLVWFPSQKWEMSGRFWYAYHGKNKDFPLGALQPGQRFHINYAASYQVSPRFRVGGAGYYLQQLTEDKIGGMKQSGSKERVAAFGPGLVVMNGPAPFLVLSHPIEFGVKNRFKGSRTTLQMIYKF